MHTYAEGASMAEQQQDENQTLTTFISEKAPVIVVTMAGYLTSKSIAGLNECWTGIEASQAKFVIIQLRDIAPEIDAPMIVAFARFQKQIRTKPAVLRICSIHPDLRRVLDAKGVLRNEEVAGNLVEALKSLTRITSHAA
jgi:anti-anti-sigma regulatory factor